MMLIKRQHQTEKGILFCPALGSIKKRSWVTFMVLLRNRQSVFFLLFVFFYFFSFPILLFHDWLAQRLLGVKIGWGLLVENRKFKLQISLFPLDVFCLPWSKLKLEDAFRIRRCIKCHPVPSGKLFLRWKMDIFWIMVLFNGGLDLGRLHLLQTLQKMTRKELVRG